MYAPSKVRERLAIAAAEFRITPEYHSVADVDAFEKYLVAHDKYKYSELGAPESTQNLTPLDREWMLNEQVLCMCDAMYALTRYGYIKDEQNVIRRFSPRIPQRLFFDIICDLEERDAAIEVMCLKARQLGALDPETKVLTNDLRWIPLDTVKVGDEVVGTDEYGVGGPGHERKLRSSTVLRKWEVQKEAFKITMENGSILIATEDHKFLCKKRGSNTTEWREVRCARKRGRPAPPIEPGDEVRLLCSPWSDSLDFEDGWFAGLLDGEGSLRAKNGAGTEITVSQVEGAVLDRARKYLQSRGIQFSVECDRRKAGKSSKLGNKPVFKLVLQRLPEVLRILGRLNPSRWRGRRVWEGKTLPSSGEGRSWIKVKSVEALGARRMVDMETTSKTFIAEGFVTHNCSTLIELLIALRIIFGYGINAVIGSADQTKTALMSNMLFLFYDNLPIWLRPHWTRRVESERGMLVFGHSASGVSFQHGAQTSGIARGTTPTIYHLSECASFTDPVNQIEASLFKAVHASPSVFGVLESTGEGDKGWWPDTWRHAKANWIHHRARLCPLFLPWFCGRDIYPTPTWLRMRPVPDDWRPNHDTRIHVAKSELYVHSSPLLSRHLGEHWKMPLEQQWYWEVEHEQAKAKNIESVFLQEMAGDDEEALQRSSESVFGHEAIAVIDEKRKREYAIYGFTGQSIEDSHEPPTEYIDYSRDRIPVRLTSTRGETHRWELVPLRFHTPPREDNSEDTNGMLFVFHPPAPNVKYSIGIDTSEGKGEDSTVISVWALGSGQSHDTQVAEFASAYVSHTEAFAFGAAIGAYYGLHMTPETTKLPLPYCTIEQVAAVGDTCQSQMMRMGYPTRCFHAFTRQDLTPRQMAQRKRSAAVKRGWYTYGWSRPILTGYFVQCARNGWIEINSPWLIEEMKQFEVHVTATGKERLEHGEGQHDDRIFAAAMATFCPHDQDVVAYRSKNRSEESLALPPVDLTPSSSSIFSSADLRDSRTLTLQDILYSDTSSLRRHSY